MTGFTLFLYSEQNYDLPFEAGGKRLNNEITETSSTVASNANKIININKEEKNMATYLTEPSHTFSEYLLIPGYTDERCIPANVSLRTPPCKIRKGQGGMSSYAQYPHGIRYHAVGIRR